MRTALGVSNELWSAFARNRERHLLGGGVFGGPRHAHSEPAFRALSRNRRYVARAMRARRLGAGATFPNTRTRACRPWPALPERRRCREAPRRLRPQQATPSTMWPISDCAVSWSRAARANMPGGFEIARNVRRHGGHQRPPDSALDDDVGERFEKGKFFLPQLMASAEAAKAGFDVIKEQGGSGAVADKGWLPSPR